MKTHGNTKTTQQFFLGPRMVKEILGNDYKLSAEQETKICEFFDYFSDKDRSSIWRKNIATWIKHGLDNWINRRQELLRVTSNSSEFFDIMYGPELGKTLYQELVNRITTNLPSTIEHWTLQGYSIDDAKHKVRESQQLKNKKSVAKLKGTSEYTVRSTAYWKKHGYSDLQAADMVASIQRRDEAYYIDKYGIDAGVSRFEQAKAKRKNTWSKKDKTLHAVKTAPKSFNASGQEMQAINAFLAANSISSAYCKFGTPAEQFYQWIPGTGYRRYDLAVYYDLEHTKLKYIFEYHGPGHINFSDFVSELRNEQITIAGKKLLHLGTYGNAYDNDLVKRNHILTTYPDVKYIVMWTDDLKNRRFLLDELL